MTELKHCYSRKLRETDPEKYKSYLKRKSEYYHANREKLLPVMRKNQKAYYQAHREAILEKSKQKRRELASLAQLGKLVAASA